MSKIKEHFKKYKLVYIVGGSCLLLGATAGAVFMSRQIVIVDALNLKINSPTTNEITTLLIRRGHPGNLVKCLETGEVFASQNRAAQALDLNKFDLSKHLRGLKDSAGGLHFENLGLAT